jgi:hypothetical protein
MTDTGMKQLINNYPPRLYSLSFYDCPSITCQTIVALAFARQDVVFSSLECKNSMNHCEWTQTVNALKTLLYRNTIYSLQLEGFDGAGDKQKNLQKQLQDYFVQQVQRPSNFPGCSISCK